MIEVFIAVCADSQRTRRSGKVLFPLKLVEKTLTLAIYILAKSLGRVGIGNRVAASRIG